MKNILIIICFLSCLFISNGYKNDNDDLKKRQVLMSKEEVSFIGKTDGGSITALEVSDNNMGEAIKIITNSTSRAITPWLTGEIGGYNAKYIFAFANGLALQKILLEEYWFWCTASVYKAAADGSLCEDKQAGQHTLLYAIGL